MHYNDDNIKIVMRSVRKLNPQSGEGEKSTSILVEGLERRTSASSVPILPMLPRNQERNFLEYLAIYLDILLVNHFVLVFFVNFVICIILSFL